MSPNNRKGGQGAAAIGRRVGSSPGLGDVAILNVNRHIQPMLYVLSTGPSYTFLEIAFKLALSEIGGRAYIKIYYRVSRVNNFLGAI